MGLEFEGDLPRYPDLYAQSYIERDGRACRQMETFIVHDDGSYGAMEGEKDDAVDVRGIGLLIHQGAEGFEALDPPTYVAEAPLVTKHKAPRGSAANFG